jgi:hypothetical protein
VVDKLCVRLDDIDTDQADYHVIATIKAIIDAATGLRQYARHLDLSVRNHVAELQLRAQQKAAVACETR